MKLVPSRAYLKVTEETELGLKFATSYESEATKVRMFTQKTFAITDLEPQQEGVLLIVSPELIHHINPLERPDVFAIDWRGICYQIAPATTEKKSQE